MKLPGIYPTVSPQSSHLSISPRTPKNRATSLLLPLPDSSHHDLPHFPVLVLLCSCARFWLHSHSTCTWTLVLRPICLYLHPRHWHCHVCAGHTHVLDTGATAVVMCAPYQEIPLTTAPGERTAGRAQQYLKLSSEKKKEG